MTDPGEPLQVLEDAVRTYLATSTDQASVLVADLGAYQLDGEDDGLD